MTEIQLAVISLIVGSAISALVSWYFFRKSSNKKLSAYVQFASPVLGGIDDPRVREALEIRYRGTKIADLVQLQFVVANEGQRAIRDLIEPLHLLLPKSVSLLEARVLYVQPRGREVNVDASELDTGETRVDIKFKLLNRGEFFFVKLLLNGGMDFKDLRFCLTVDDLPPSIVPKPHPFRASEDEPIAGWRAVLAGSVPLALALSSLFVLHELSAARPILFPGAIGFQWFSLETLALGFWIGSIIYWLVRSGQLVVARGIFGPRLRFHLPDSIRRADYHRIYGSELSEHLLTTEKIRFISERIDDPSISEQERRMLIRRLMRYERLRHSIDSELGRES